MNNILVQNIVKNHTPLVEGAKKISTWFKDETIEINFGEYVGRPSANITMHKDYLAKFLENGWTIESVSKGREDGKWERVQKSSSEDATNSAIENKSKNEYASSSFENSESNKENNSKDDSNSNSQNNYTSRSDSTMAFNSGDNSSSNSASSSSSGASAESSSSSGKGSSGSSSSSSNSSNTSNTSSSSSAGFKTQNDSNTGSNTTASSSNSSETKRDTSKSTDEKSTESGNTTNASETRNEDTKASRSSESSDDTSYWAAYQLIKLKRRRMQPELVLQSMVSSFTNAYNSGRSIENDRYNEMVSLYAVTLSQTENEYNNLISGAMNLTPLFNKIYNSVMDSFKAAESSARTVSETGIQDALNDVNRQFDATESAAKAQMVSNGTYNTTVWATVIAGISRQRSAAITKAKFEGSQTSANTFSSIASARGSISASLIAAKQAMSDAADRRKMSATEARNAVIKWIVDFAGQREEVYPELQEISTLTERLGFSVGSAGNVL